MYQELFQPPEYCLIPTMILRIFLVDIQNNPRKSDLLPRNISAELYQRASEWVLPRKVMLGCGNFLGFYAMRFPSPKFIFF